MAARRRKGFFLNPSILSRVPHFQVIYPSNDMMPEDIIANSFCMIYLVFYTLIYEHITLARQERYNVDFGMPDIEPSDLNVKVEGTTTEHLSNTRAVLE